MDRKNLQRSTRMALGLCLVFGLTGLAVAKPRASDSVVKVQATLDKPGADGKQTVTVTLTMDKDWHVYAHSVGNQDLSDTQTVVVLRANGNPVEAKFDYPAGKVVMDKTIGNYKIYEGSVAIKAQIPGSPGNASALEVQVTLQACSDKYKTCLLPSTIKKTVR